MYRDFIRSLTAFGQSFWYVSKFKLWKYVFLLIFLLLIFAAPVLLIDQFFQWILGLLPFNNGEKYTNMGVSVLAGISGFVLLLVLSPVFSMVSEEVMQQLAGKSYRFSATQLLKDIFRGIRITLRNLVYQYFVIVLVYLLLFLLPERKFFEIIGTSIIILFTSYFYGFSLLDYAMENQRMNYRQSVEFVRSHPGLAIGLGGILYLMISINDWQIAQDLLGKSSIYWSAFAEAIVAFFGVIAGSLLLFKKIEK